MKIRDICITVIVAALSAAAVSFVVVRLAQRPTTTIEGFRALDATGHVRGQFKLFPDDTARFTIRDAEGKESVRLCVEPGGSAYLWLMQGTGCAAVGVGTERAYLNLKDANGEVTLTTEDIIMEDANGTHRLDLRSLKIKE